MKSTIDENESARSDRADTVGKSSAEAPLLIHFQTIKDYERLYKPEQLAGAVLTMDHESVVIRRPLWWTKDGKRIPDTRPGMDLDQLCERYGWKVVAQFGNHFAVVAPQEDGEVNGER